MSNNPKKNVFEKTQSQYERRVARQRQLELMEATASGTAPTMELDTSSFASSGSDENGRFLRARNSDTARRFLSESSEENRPLNITPAIPTVVPQAGSVFDRHVSGRSAGDRHGELNLMDHETGIYKREKATWSDTFNTSLDRFRKVVIGGPETERNDAVAADSDYYVGDVESSYAKRLSPIWSAIQKCCANRRLMTRLFAVIFGGFVLLVAIISITNGDSEAQSGTSNKEEIFLKNSERYHDIQDTIVRNGITKLEVLEDGGTAQYHALRWVAYTDPVKLAVDDPVLLERYALAVFFYASFLSFQEKAGHQEFIELEQYEGVPNPGWTRKDYWMSAHGHCQWWGIRCIEVQVDDEQDSAGSAGLGSTGGQATASDGTTNLNRPISSFSMPHNYVYGTFPAEFNALTRLEYLDLSYNNLHGTLPQDTRRMFHLKDLKLNHNSFTGTIPKQIGFLEGLQSMNLVQNQFKGSLPTEMNRLFNLRDLFVSNNAFTGSIPDLQNCNELAVLQLDHNQFSGKFPFGLVELRKLVEVHFNDNRLTGTIPPELQTNTKLERLYLENNQLSGNLHETLFEEWKSLQEVALYNNAFTGPLPKSMGSNPNLRLALFNNNQFNGAIPAEWKNMLNLEILHLYQNSLSGVIPSQIGQQSSLRELWVHENKLSGNIPTELGNCVKMERLFLEHNRLSGTVPSELGKLTELRTLRVFDNNVVAIPSEICSLTEKSSGTDHHLSFLAADCVSDVTCQCCHKCY